MENEAISAGAIREIIDLHAFFEAWLSGRSPADENRLKQALQSVAADFTLVGPAGRRLDRAGLLTWLAPAHGSRGGDFRIWVENIMAVSARPGMAILGYDECQHMNGTQTRRTATVVFVAAPECPNGVAWLAVHETWVQPA